MVDIESNEYEQLSQRIYFTTVYPYESFYTTGINLSYLFSLTKQQYFSFAYRLIKLLINTFREKSPSY